jgi:hypothetical protein
MEQATNGLNDLNIRRHPECIVGVSLGERVKKEEVPSIPTV